MADKEPWRKEGDKFCVTDTEAVGQEVARSRLVDRKIWKKSCEDLG
jgi:hypothetical protein